MRDVSWILLTGYLCLCILYTHTYTHSTNSSDECSVKRLSAKEMKHAKWSNISQIHSTVCDAALLFSARDGQSVQWRAFHTDETNCYYFQTGMFPHFCLKYNFSYSVFRDLLCCLLCFVVCQKSSMGGCRQASFAAGLSYYAAMQVILMK